MKYFIYLVNCLLIIAIPLMIVTGISKDSKTASTTIEVKKVNSLKLYTKQEQLKRVIPQEEKVVEEKIEVVETEIIKQEEVPEENNQEEEVEEEIQVEIPNDVLETLTGRLSGYGPDCVGCSGYTSSGYNISSTIYYHDSTYGSVRILSADRSFSLGSIVRVKNSKIGDFIGIVLDRGGNVGIGKAYLFDLLFSSEKEAYAYGVSSNVTFEVLRNGY